MIAIRAAHRDDAGAIAAIYAPHVTAGTATFELVAPDGAVIAARMAAARALYPWLVATEDGAVIGYGYAAAYSERAAYRWAVETSVYVAASVQGRGVGRALYATLLQTLEQRGFTQALARIALPNPASLSLHEALGFRSVGVLRGMGYKLGQWIDVGLWQRSLADPQPADEGHPTPPIPAHVPLTGQH